MDPSAIPDTSNLFGELDTTGPPDRVANLYGYRGWQVRKSSWTEFEVTCEFAELVIHQSSSHPDRMLIHGAVADVIANLPAITNPLADAGVRYTLECYDENWRLIHETRG